MTYLLMFLGGLLGVALHSLFKIRSINRRMENETYKTVFAKYFKSDWISVLTSVVVVITAMFISSEYLNLKQDAAPTPGNIAQFMQYKIATFIKTTFVFVGWGADSIVYSILGTLETKLLKKAKDGGVNINDN